MTYSHELALDVFSTNLESAGSDCKVVEQQLHGGKEGNPGQRQIIGEQGKGRASSPEVGGASWKLIAEWSGGLNTLRLSALP
ncbi:hypothetical protein D6D17_07309 [Aureobasidium pullulans]|nr:hypothetical protein D6D17_07309 [Aureobasidium pullulans]